MCGSVIVDGTNSSSPQPPNSYEKFVAPGSWYVTVAPRPRVLQSDSCPADDDNGVPCYILINRLLLSTAVVAGVCIQQPVEDRKHYLARNSNDEMRC